MIGCDPYYGIIRFGALETLPAPSCVETAIRSIPGVQEEEFIRGEGSRPLTWTGIQKPDDVYAYLYRGEDFEGAVTLARDYAGRTRFRQNYGGLHQVVPQEKVDAVRPVMMRIEEILTTRCGFKLLDRDLEQICSGVECS